VYFSIMDNRGIGSRVPTLGLHGNFGRVVADGEVLEDTRSQPYAFNAPNKSDDVDFIDGAPLMTLGIGEHFTTRQDSYDLGYSSVNSLHAKPEDEGTSSWQDAGYPSVLGDLAVSSSEPSAFIDNDDEAYGSISSIPSPDVIFSQDMDGDTMLHIAIIHENEPMSLAFIAAAQKPSDLSLVNALGQTALHLSSYMNLSSVVEALIRQQVALDVRNRQGNTALHLACREGHLEAARLLVAAQPGLTAVMNYEGLTCLHLAVKHEHIRVVEMLMQSGAVNVNAGDGCSGRTVLHHAVQAGNQDWVQFLIRECAADVSARSRDGLTPVMIAAGQQRHNLVEMLVAAGAVYETAPAMADDDAGFCSDDDDSSVEMETYDLSHQVQHLSLYAPTRGSPVPLTNGHISPPYS